MAKVILVSFADSKFSPTADRLRKEAEDFGFFFSINIPSEKEFDRWYRRKYWFRLLQKGMGFWMWKSYLVKKYYDQLDEGDILFYIDAGCVLNKNGIKRFNEYIKLVNDTASGIMVFQQGLIEKQYTKADVFHYLDVETIENIINTGQIYAGAYMIKKGPIGKLLIDKVYETCHNRFDLLSNNPSKIPNYDAFVCHRYDQSIFSVVVKTFDPTILSANETYPSNGDWRSLEGYPIWSKRLKQYNKWYKILYRGKFAQRKMLDYLVRNNYIKF